MTSLTVSIGDSFLPLMHDRARDRFVLCEGPRGTAKTNSILTVLVAYGLAHPGARIGLFRSTRTRLSATVLVTLEEQVLPRFGIPVPGDASREHRSAYRLPGGSVLLPIGMDDLMRSQSLELAKAYIAEGVELEKPDDALAIAATLRQAGMPDPQCIVDCNPGAPAHWLNSIAEPVPKSLRRVASRHDYQEILNHNNRPAKDGAWKRIITRHQDNPAYWNFDTWDWTDEGRQYLQTLGELKGHLRRRWLDGDWVAAEGAVYKEFDDDKHVIDSFSIPKEWPCWLAKDPGRDHPDATVVAALSPDGTLFIVAESVVRNTINATDAKVLDQFSQAFRIVRKLGDPHMMFSATKFSESGRTIAEQYRDFGHVFMPAPAARNQADIAQQVEMVRTLLTSIGPDGEPKLQVFRSCTGVIRGFQTWGYVRNTRGEMTGGEDRFEDVDDDEMDCVRMIVASRPSFSGPQWSVSVGER